jgi:hypothetical protein
MDLEQYLGHRLYMIHAYDLIHAACQLVSFIEEKKHRYPEYLHPFVANKETYDVLHKELDKLVDKYKLRSSVGSQGDTDDEEEEDENLQYKKLLEDADKLVVRDPTWDQWYYDGYLSRNRAN